ncbi:MAG: AAA family ATPase, partial [Deltaproteobacteria bacterium]|nr:AAA family ATPase [Deltaproteobacteria bacterium]
VDPALKLMIEAVQHYDGYIVQSTGDGIFALFGAPVAHEDHPQRALYAALRIQDQIHRYADNLRAEGRAPLQIRIGVNAGEVVVRSIRIGEAKSEYTPIGHTANLAARMQTLANPGSIVIAENTRRLVEGYFTLRSLGASRVKGLANPINVFEVTGLGPLRTRLQRAAARGLTKFIGREREMEALRHAAQLARAGHGQVVATMAEPGIGKSRLFHEFKLISKADWMVLQAFSVSHGKATAYLPVIDLLHEYFAIESSDDTRRRREKVGGKVLMLERSLEDTLPYLFALLGLNDGDDQLAQMGPQIRRRRMHEAIKRILLRESLNQPLMVIFEDLHWIDGETQDLLNLLLDSLATARILLLVNYRPEYQHQWGSRTHYTQLRLDPLGKESAGEMLDALLTSPAPVTLSAGASRERSGDDIQVGDRVRVQHALAPLKRLIIERTQGNPFFMEEIVLALLDDGALVRNGEVKLTRSLAELKIPPTVQTTLAARIDRLPAAEKELLQILAVIGQQIALEPIKHVTGRSEEQLEALLSNLQSSEFIYEQPILEGAEYVFKHALTQEVSYNSLLGERRRMIHAQAGQAIEAVYVGQLEGHYSELARHHLRGNDAAKAVHYAQLAAEQALGRGAYAEAANLIDAALKVLARLPETDDRLRSEFALRTIESTVTFVVYGANSSERERAVVRMRELGERLGGGQYLLRGLIPLSNMYFTRGEAVRGLELARRSIDLAEGSGDAASLLAGLFYAGLLANSCGKFQESLSFLNEAVRHSVHKPRSLSPSGYLYESALPCHLAQPLLLLGQVGESRRLTEEGLRRARESSHLFSLVHALVLTTVLFELRREPEKALVSAEEAIELSQENGFPQWLQMSRSLHGLVLVDLGQFDKGSAEIEEAHTLSRPFRSSPMLLFRIARLAHTYARMEQTDRAVQMLSDALAQLERTGERFSAAEMLRLKGEVLLMCHGAAKDEAEHCFRAALEIARAQQAKWWELRTSVSLARLLFDTDRRDEARPLLTEIFCGFTEGFELSDLKEAKALLDELNA